MEKWSLDPDFIEEGPEGTKEKFKLFVSGIIKQKFEGEKYLEEVPVLCFSKLSRT